MEAQLDTDQPAARPSCALAGIVTVLALGVIAALLLLVVALRVGSAIS